jgi:hypothetical protein
MKITLQGKKLTIETLIKKRTKIYGFGTFLEKPKQGEVVCNKAAFEMLSRCPARRGLMAIEIFNGPIVSYGAPNLKFTGVPMEYVSVQPGAWKELEKLVVVEE